MKPENVFISLQSRANHSDEQRSRVCYCKFNYYVNDHRETYRCNKHAIQIEMHTQIHKHTHTQWKKKKKTAAATPWVLLLDAVFVPRALREVCLLAEPLWSLQQTCLACCCAGLCCSLLEEISVNGRGMHWFDEWVHICGSTGGQCAVWWEMLFLWLELHNKAFSFKRRLQRITVQWMAIRDAIFSHWLYLEDNSLAAWHFIYIFSKC